MMKIKIPIKQVFNNKSFRRIREGLSANADDLFLFSEERQGAGTVGRQKKKSPGLSRIRRGGNKNCIW